MQVNKSKIKFVENVVKGVVPTVSYFFNSHDTISYAGQFEDARALISSKVCYIWDAMLATHDDILNQFVTWLPNVAFNEDTFARVKFKAVNDKNDCPIIYDMELNSSIENIDVALEFLKLKPDLGETIGEIELMLARRRRELDKK